MRPVNTWYDYVRHISGNATQKTIAEAADVDQTTVSRWKEGAFSPSPGAVSALARNYGRNVLEAFVAAGFLTDEEAGTPPPPTVDLATVEGELLAAEVARRLTQAPTARGVGSRPRAHQRKRT